MSSQQREEHAAKAQSTKSTEDIMDCVTDIRWGTRVHGVGVAIQCRLVLMVCFLVLPQRVRYSLSRASVH